MQNHELLHQVIANAQWVDEYMPALLDTKPGFTALEIRQEATSDL